VISISEARKTSLRCFANLVVASAAEWRSSIESFSPSSSMLYIPKAPADQADYYEDQYHFSQRGT